MARSFIQAYALTVCFSALMCFVIALGLGLYDVVRITNPAFTIADQMLWQNDEHFLLYHPDKKDLPPLRLASLREEYRQMALTAERRGAQQRLVFVAIIAGIDVVVYAFHWRLGRGHESNR